MNEKIREIALEAGGSTYPEVNTTQLVKFAELILQDVLDICEDLGDKGMDGHYCVDAIRRKYFG